MKIPALFIIALQLFSVQLTAQEEEPATGNARIWEARLAGGEYMVAVQSIRSLSYHTFYAEGGVKVTEVVIDNGGRSLVRFYTFAAASPTAEGQEVLDGIRDSTAGAANDAGIDMHRVVKNYPTTTHAHTVEYRLPNEPELLRLYEHAKRAWERQRGAVFVQGK